MNERPTFLLTDVEGSTRLWEDHPARMAPALAWHDEIVAHTVGEHGGHLVKTRGEGDSSFSVFADPVDAVRAAVAVGARLAEGSAPVALRVRAAVHTGPVEARDGDYYGPTVNRCARLRGAAHGGQIVVSEAVARAVETALPPDATLRDLGLHRFRDLARPERVYQVCHPSLPDDFPPLASLDDRRHNLPVAVSRFVGRDKEVQAVGALLAEHRHVTITGLGGAGKTRVALHAAAAGVERHADGVWLVELASVDDGELVLPLVAHALGAREEPGRPLLDTLTDRLRRSEMLLVLDNCEHVAGAAAVAEELLNRCGGLRILATSILPLGTPGEAVWPLPPLSTDDATQLFIDRARLLGGLAPGAEVEEIDRICTRLEGHPLAIELAAARTAVLTPAQLAQRLEDTFAVLGSPRRTGPSRHHTLRATLDWSYGLLDPAEQHALQALAMLGGSFDLAAVEAMVPDGGMERLDGLVAKSMVSRSDRRFHMLGTVRAYGRERLAEAGSDAEAVAGSRLLAWAETVAAARDVHRTDAELPSLRQALAWAQERHPEAGLEVARNLYSFWADRGLFSEGRRWLDQLVAAAAPSEARADARSRSAWLAALSGDLDAAFDGAETARAEADAGGWDSVMDRALNTLATVAHQRGDLRTAEGVWTEMLERARAANDDPALCRALGNLAGAARQTGRTDEARRFGEEALAVARRIGNDATEAAMLSNLSRVAQQAGDFASALALAEEGLAVSRRRGHLVDIAHALLALATIAVENERIDDADGWARECLATATQLDYLPVMANAALVRAEVHRLRGETDEAAALVEQAASGFAAMGHEAGQVAAAVVRGLTCAAAGDRAGAATELTAAVAAAARLESDSQLASAIDAAAGVAVADQPAAAARLLGAAAALHRAAGETLSPATTRHRDGVAATARAALGDDYDAEFAAGETLTAVAAAADAEAALARVAPR